MSAGVGSVGSVGSLGTCLDQVRSWVSRFVVVMREDDLDVLTLWIVHTWLAEETYTTPRLLIDSPVPGSGKTTLLDHLSKLCKSPVQMASVSSAALLARITADGTRTLLIDEADRSLDPKRPGSGDLIAILNSGYKKGGSRPVNVPGKGGDWEMREMPTYSPVAIAGNTPLLPDDTRSRCIVVRLMPDLAGNAEESDWEYLEIDAQDLHDHIQEAVEPIREAVRMSRPQLPAGCKNRHRERWKPLAKVASVAGDRWVSKCNELIEADLALAADAAENGDTLASPVVTLAQDLHKVLSGENRQVPSTEIVRQLVKLNPEAWSMASTFGKELTYQRMGRMLNRAYGLYSQRIGANARGWHPNQFTQVWERLGITQNKPTIATEPTEPTTDRGLF
jgi:hypothetical protein